MERRVRCLSRHSGKIYTPLIMCCSLHHSNLEIGRRRSSGLRTFVQNKLSGQPLESKKNAKRSQSELEATGPTKLIVCDGLKINRLS